MATKSEYVVLLEKALVFFADEAGYAERLLYPEELVAIYKEVSPFYDDYEEDDQRPGQPDK